MDFFYNFLQPELPIGWVAWFWALLWAALISLFLNFIVAFILNLFAQIFHIIGFQGASLFNLDTHILLKYFYASIIVALIWTGLIAYIWQTGQYEEILAFSPYWFGIITVLIVGIILLYIFNKKVKGRRARLCGLF